MTRAALLAALLACAAAAALAQRTTEIRVAPDPHLTPGLAATHDQRDVCSRASGTYSQRHRLSQTESVKREVMARYGVAWADRGAYEDDHALPLCAGGSDDIANRWPQPRAGATWVAADKDRLEAETCRAICAGEVSLDDGQRRFIAPAVWIDSYCAAFPDDRRCRR